MSQITSRGRHLPGFRIQTTTVRDQWGGGSSGVREKAVQARDDDPLTLALRVARPLVDDREDVGVLCFATATPVYGYGSVAPTLVEALGLGADTYALSFRESERAGTAALRAAHDAVEASGTTALVVAADAPMPEPGTDREKTAGAGASAVLVEPDDGAMALAGRVSRTRSVLDGWQAPGESTRHRADDRFAREWGYVETTAGAVEAVLDDVGWATDDVAALAATQPDPKFLSRLGSATGLDVATSELARDAGGLGSASALAALAGAEVEPGSRVVVAGYGTGTADALAYTVGDVPPAVDTSEPPTELSYVEYLEHTGNLRGDR